MRHCGCSGAGKMKGTLFLIFITYFINLTIQDELLPRGPRPVENVGLRSSCSEEKKWPICTDDDLGPKCPSGCRIQGLIDVKNQQNDQQVQEIRLMLEDYSKMFGKTHITVTEAVNRIKQSLDGLGRFGNAYYQQVDHLNSRLNILQTRINKQISQIKLLRNSILEQFRDIARLEVDIDIKIRACKRSCKRSFIYNIDRERNAQMEKYLRSMTSFPVETIQYGKPTHAFKMRLLKDGTNNSNFKTYASGDPYPNIWEVTNVGEFTLETNTEDSSGTETRYATNYDQTVSAIPHSNGKIITDASSVSSTSHSGEQHTSADNLDENSHITNQHFNHSIITYSSSGSVTTKTIISKGGKVTETVTTGVSDSFPHEFEYLFDGLKMPLTTQTKGSVSNLLTHHLPNFESLRTSDTKSDTSKTGSTIVHTKTLTTTDDSSDFSNLGDYHDFSTPDYREPSVRTDRISSSTKTVTVTHERETQQSSSSSHPKGFIQRNTHDVNVPSLPNVEAGDQPLASK